VFFVSFVVYFLFFHRLADRDLWSSHEARAAMDSQSILDDGDWTLPHLYDGRLELQKPPLYYWMVAVIARLRGGVVDAWAVRLPATLSALGCIVVVACILWRRGRPVAGLIAATVLATALHFTWLARVGRIDMPLALAVATALGGWYAAWDAPPRGRRLNGLALCLALAAGLLLKGPIALVLPLAALGAFALIEREWPWRPARRLGLWWQVPLALGLAAPWFIWANARTDGELFRTFFLHHNLERALGENIVGRWEHPWWLYGPLYVWDFLPWSAALPAATWWLWRGGWRADREARFGVAWLLAMLVVLSCVAFKRSDYLLPAYPGAALLLGCAGERRLLTSVDWRRWAVGFAAFAIACVVGWTVYLEAFMPKKDLQWEYRRFAAEIRRRAPFPMPVSFFRTETHALAFHVGRPLAIFVEWDELNAQTTRPESRYVVMPLARFAECEQHALAGRFETLLTSTDLPGCKHNKPLVLLRTRPVSARADESADAGTATTAADCRPTAQRPPAGQQ
jgi:4-amino-4-deoxy-L-arabinose transferase-like glycosyltransferase